MPLTIQHDETPTLNLTSMIDVLFLLIIFFMVATKFDEMERNVAVSVPQVAETTNDSTARPPLVVTIQSDGTIHLDGQAVTLAELTSQLAEIRTPMGEPAVIVRGDASCAFQHIAEALTACRQAGISELGITVRIAGIGAVGR